MHRGSSHAGLIPLSSRLPARHRAGAGAPAPPSASHEAKVHKQRVSVDKHTQSVSGFFPSELNLTAVGSPPTAARPDRKQLMRQPPFDMEHQERVHPTAKHKRLKRIQTRDTFICMPLCLHQYYTLRHLCKSEAGS